MNNKPNLKKMTELAIFIAIIIVMKLTGLSSVPVGPLVMTFTMVPIAIGAMLLGPAEGAVLGFVYGITSLYDAITGASAMTGFFFQLSPVHTVILCVVTRTLVGLLTGLIFKALKKIEKKKAQNTPVLSICFRVKSFRPEPGAVGGGGSWSM